MVTPFPSSRSPRQPLGGTPARPGLRADRDAGTGRWHWCCSRCPLGAGCYLPKLRSAAGLPAALSGDRTTSRREARQPSSSRSYTEENGPGLRQGAGPVPQRTACSPDWCHSPPVPRRPAAGNPVSSLASSTAHEVRSHNCSLLAAPDTPPRLNISCRQRTGRGIGPGGTLPVPTAVFLGDRPAGHTPASGRQRRPRS